MDADFQQLLAERAERDPHGIAVIDETGSLTNAQLDAQISAVAQEVTALGADRVAIVASNSSAYLVHAFGVWRAGGLLVTVYPSSPSDEIAYALEHSGVELVYADAECAPRIPSGVRVLDLAERAPAPRPSLTGSPRPEARALVCYTSGSTQRPKAVVHTHAGLLAGARAYADVWHLGASDTTLVVLPMAWVFGLTTTSMAAIASGGRVRSVRRARADALREAILRDEVTFIAGVTTIFAKLLDAVREGGLDGHRVRLCISGGEPRNERVFDAWRTATGVPVHDVYAASECFPVVTYDPQRDPEPVDGCAGRVAPGSALRLWDADRETWIDGPGVGEAFVRGGALFVEYEGDPETTAAARTADGWYRTGDLVELRPDGLVKVLGRLSGMIIRGGANVSPAEIERVMHAMPEVDVAIALGLPDEQFGQRIVAVVRPAAGEHVDPQAVIDGCARSLAAYKVPSAVVVLDELPLNERTGKYDRRALEAQLLEMSA
jgi:long-chain acyl-CoA synthetase